MCWSHYHLVHVCSFVHWLLTLKPAGNAHVQWARSVYDVMCDAGSQ